MAEPALAKRDAKLRSSLRMAVGESSKRAKAVLLMDGSRSQSTIGKESGIDPGNLSRLVKSLVSTQLISADEKHPRLLVKVPAKFFDGDDLNER
jgi:predicted transcriptional regulator